MHYENVTVFCSARDDVDKDYLKLGYEVGKLLAVNEYATVTGASVSGVMGTVASGTYDFGGYNIGVYPEELSHLERPFMDCEELYIEETLVKRQEKLVELGEHFILLPGGSGSVYELFEVLTKVATGIKEVSSIIIVNYKGYYDDLIKQIVKMEKEKTYNMPDNLFVARDVDDILPILIGEPFDIEV